LAQAGLSQKFSRKWLYFERRGMREKWPLFRETPRDFAAVEVFCLRLRERSLLSMNFFCYLDQKHLLFLFFYKTRALLLGGFTRPPSG
jgi:GT2 family glycosyltransferase